MKVFASLFQKAAGSRGRAPGSVAGPQHVAWMLTLTSLLLTLSGCAAGLPQSRESGHNAVVSLLAAKTQENGICLYAAAEGREQEDPKLFQGQGNTPAAAVAALEDQGEQVVDRAHVEHMILDESSPQLLPELLSYAFRESQQSTETFLWIIRGEGLETLFSSDGDAAQRMNVLKTAAKDHQGFASVTLLETAAILAEGDAVLLPALEADQEGLRFWGYGLYHDGAFQTWLTGDAALGAGLLRGDTIHWTTGVEDRAMTLHSTGCTVTPYFTKGTLTGLGLHCRLEGVVLGGWESAAEDPKRLEEETARCIRTAAARLQLAGQDGAELARRAGLRRWGQWTAIREQWQEQFPKLEIGVEVHLTVAERY